MVFVAASYGIVNVNWSATAGFFWTVDPFEGILGDATGNSTRAQLMYSPDASKDDIELNGEGFDNDVIWDSLVITENGVSGDFDDYASFGDYGSFGTQNYQQAFVSKKVSGKRCQSYPLTFLIEGLKLAVRFIM